MPGIKETKQDVSNFWKLLKQERRARSKLNAASELAESAARLARLANDLKKLSVRMAWHESKANQPVRTKRHESKRSKAIDTQQVKLSPRKASSRNAAPSEEGDKQE